MKAFIVITIIIYFSQASAQDFNAEVVKYLIHDASVSSVHTVDWLEKNNNPAFNTEGMESIESLIKRHNEMLSQFDQDQILKFVNSELLPFSFHCSQEVIEPNDDRDNDKDIHATGIQFTKMVEGSLLFKITAGLKIGQTWKVKPTKNQFLRGNTVSSSTPIQIVPAIINGTIVPNHFILIYYHLRDDPTNLSRTLCVKK